MKLEMPPFQQARVLVVGDVMLDRYWHGKATRISPEAPVPVVRVGNSEDRPGGAGNVALNISALGAAASGLEAAGVYCEFAQCSSAPTITKLRVISQHQQLLRVDFEEGFTANAVAEFQAHALKLVENAQVLVLSDYSKGALENTQSLIQAAKALGIPVVVDPKGDDFSKYRGATVITPNLNEFDSSGSWLAVIGRSRIRGAFDYAWREWHDATALGPSGVAYANPRAGSV